MPRPYRRNGFGYGGFNRSRFRIGPVFYGHHRFRPYYPYFNRSRFNIGIGFGFYGGCFSTPLDYYYPSYYPAYVSPTYISETIVYEDSDDYVVIDNNDPEVLVIDGSGGNSGQNAQGYAPPPNVPQYDADNPLAQKINQGADEFERGQYETASSLFEEVALADRNNADAWFALGTAKFATGDYARGASAIRQGIQVFPEMVNTVFDIRDRYGNIEDFQRHVESLERRIESNPDDMDAHIMLGFVYHFTGQREWAGEVFDYIAEKSPNDAHLARVFKNAKPAPNGPVSNNSTSTQRQPRTIVAQNPPQPRTIVPQNPNPPVATPRVFQGAVSDEGDVAPKRLLTIDGIVIEFDDVDDDPLEADFDVFVGATRIEFEKVRQGQRVAVRGQSGREYWITPININKHYEKITFTVMAR